MKILQMLPALEIGGVERGVIDLAKTMKERGHVAPVMSSGGALVAELQKMGVPHYELPVHKKSIASLALVPKIVDIVRRHHIDAIHARSRVPAWLGWLAAKKAHIPFLTTCHGYYSTHLMSRVMGYGNPLIVPSNIIGRHMIDHFGVSPEVVRLIPRGVDLNHFEFCGERLGKVHRPLRIIHVGRFSPIKGQVEFLEAIHLVRSQVSDIEVWMVGKEGKGKTKYTDKIKETIERYHLSDCVKLLGASKDVPSLLKQTDLLVMSTLVPEAFGRVIIEAGAVGVPVISTNVGGVVDIIDHQKNGLLVPMKHSEKMAEAIVTLLKDRDLAKTYALNLRKKVEDHFTLDHMVDKTIGVYEELGKQKKILLVKLGAVGDVILAVPSMRMIKKRFPDSKLVVVTDRKMASLISGCPYVDEIMSVDRGKLSNMLYLLKTAKRLRREQFDISVDLQNTKWTHLLTFLGNVKKRYGYSRGKLGFLLNRPDKTFSKETSPVQHQFRILSRMGVQRIDDKLELWERPESIQKIEAEMEPLKLGTHTKVIAFVMGASPKWKTKRWPVAYFQYLANLILKTYDARIILLGAEHEKELVEGSELNRLNQVYDFVGKTSLDEMIAFLRKSNLLISGDTAPLHIAGAVNTPSITLFGPTDPKRHAPDEYEGTVLVKNLSCQPCYQGDCHEKEKIACLKRITPQEVFDVCRKYLG